jgi:hypothetical protein
MKRTKRKPGRPKSAKGPRNHIVKVSLHADELAEILAQTNAPAAYMREVTLSQIRKP